MKKLSWILLFSLILAACKKEKNITPSYWKIDGTEYSSDDVGKDIGKAVAVMSGRKDGSRFGITFYWPYFPKDGRYAIVKENLGQSPEKVELYIYRGSIAYHIAPSEITDLLATNVDGRAKYTLPVCWFVNYDDPTDSVRVEGVFFEP